MKTTNSMQLKAIVNNKAKQIGISAQLVLQNYVLERLLERMSLSRFSDSFIIKGGFLLAVIIGLNSRATMDLDTTVRGFDLNEDVLQGMFNEIVNINCDDDLTFSLEGISEIREGDDYPGLRVSLLAHFEKMAVSISVDVTTGDMIIPAPMLRDYPRLFGGGSFAMLSYPIETVLAEKLETVLARSTANTRARDFYDIYILEHTEAANIDFDTLQEALSATTKKRNSEHILNSFSSTVELIRNDQPINRLWVAYSKKNSYANNIMFADTLDSVLRLMASSGFKSS
jgi:predicted nucleotidyltransferase component of viral defense system